jgi:transposase-like protein
MSTKDLRIYRLASKVIDGKLSIKDFAPLVNKSYRQAQRIVDSVRKKDFLGAQHGNKGKVPWNKSTNTFEAEIMQLLKTKYEGFNLTHFREMLLECEGKEVKKTTLEKWARKHGLAKYPRRIRKAAHPPRPRLPQEGMLVQFDGSKHPWFAGVTCVLIAAIDDATGKILYAEFFEGETSMNGLKVLKTVIENHGIPEAFYFDQAGIYGKIDRDWSSQIARALESVNCRLIVASSPQAKGRVERLFRTLQDRLIAVLNFLGLDTIERANQYLHGIYINDFNARFGVAAEDPTKAYCPNVFGDLDLLFCHKLQRKVGVGNVFSWQGHDMVIAEKSNHAHRLVNINTHIDGEVSFDIMGRLVNVEKSARNYRRLKSG